MGNTCCRQKDSLNPDSKKLMKAISKKTKNNNNQIFIQVYDVENEIGKEVELNLSFLKLEGMSQINLKNSLYLCGFADSKSEISGSTFVRINPMSSPIQIDYLISSFHPHYFPSLTYVKDELIIAVGGNGSVKCELFNTRTCKWFNLPDLPEERYGAILAADEGSNSLYLFGGFNSNSNKVHSSILKLNLKTRLRWDTIVTMTDNSCFLTKCFASVCRVSKSTFLIVGGKSNTEEQSEEIVECNLSGKPSLSVKCKFKTCHPALYKNINLAGETYTHFYTFDDNAMIHKISKFDTVDSVTSFFEIKERDENFERTD